MALPPVGRQPRLEPIERWRHFSRRASAVLNIAAAIAAGRIGADEDWAALTPLNIPGFAEHLKQWGFSFAIIASRGGSGYAESCRVRGGRTVAKDRTFLFAEIMIWLKSTDVGFVLMPQGKGWQLAIGYKGGCLLSAIALQLALALAGVNLCTCSGCGNTYPREKRLPKTGQANFCPSCEEKGEPLRQADRRRREKMAEARRLHAEGVPIPEIAERLNTKPASVRRWVKKGK